MTMWNDLMEDFPVRCQELLKRAEGVAKRYDCDFTLLLAVAAAGLVIPLERMDKSHLNGDIRAHDKLGDKLKGILNKPFHRSRFCMSPRDWSYFRCKPFKLEVTVEDRWNEIAKWKSCSREPLNDGVIVQTVLSAMRNALGHGNIEVFQTEGTDDDGLIGRVGMLSITGKFKSEGPDFFTVVHTTPAALKFLLQEWFAFLHEHSTKSNLRFSRDVIHEQLEATA